MLPQRLRFGIHFQYVRPGSMDGMRVLVVEDEVYLAEAIRAGGVTVTVVLPEADLVGG
jgi:two-component system response regulator VanR